MTIQLLHYIIKRIIIMYLYICYFFRKISFTKIFTKFITSPEFFQIFFSHALHLYHNKTKGMYISLMSIQLHHCIIKRVNKYALLDNIFLSKTFLYKKISQIFNFSYLILVFVFLYALHL